MRIYTQVAEIESSMLIPGSLSMYLKSGTSDLALKTSLLFLFIHLGGINRVYYLYHFSQKTEKKEKVKKRVKQKKRN